MSKIKKCIFIRDSIIFYFENHNKNIFCIVKSENDNNNKYKIININIPKIILKDLNVLKDNICIAKTENNKYYLTRIEIERQTISLLYEFENINFIIPDQLKKGNFFIFQNYTNLINIKYYSNYNDKKYNKYLIYAQKKEYIPKFIFEDISELLNEISKLDKNDYEKFESIFLKYKTELEKKNTFYKLDNDLMDVMDNKLLKLYNSIKNKIENNKNDKDIFLNSNYIYYTLKNELSNKENNFENKEIQNIKYIVELYNICILIRQKYINYLAISTKINNIYNLNNDSLFLWERNIYC